MVFLCGGYGRALFGHFLWGIAMSENQTEFSQAELLAVINRQQESIFQADVLLRVLLRKLGDRAVLKPREVEAVSAYLVATSNDADGNFVMALVRAEPETLQ